ncbi:hypothetical protein, partial [Rhodoplanes sp. SY1]|uniref:hypothetical protein n=1 Tax=Rhodoplanes sp. SY1 TaxID=3166646 RepID=UPI0038B4555E
ALRLGVFTSAETEFAQDWDVLLRFWFDGHEPVHVPVVLYHWRQHQRSLSGSGSINQGTLSSVRGAFAYIRAHAPDPDLYDVAPYPLDLGAPDFYLHRRPDRPPPIHLLRMAWSGDAERLDTAFPFATRSEVRVSRGPQGLRALRDHAATIDAELVALVGPAVIVLHDLGLWQAVKHLELVPGSIAVSGPVFDRGARVVFGSPVRIDRETLADPLAGNSMIDTGDYSLALKPHCTYAPSVDLVLVRREA